MIRVTLTALALLLAAATTAQAGFPGKGGGKQGGGGGGGGGKFSGSSITRHLNSVKHSHSHHKHHHHKHHHHGKHHHHHHKYYHRPVYVQPAPVVVQRPVDHCHPKGSGGFFIACDHNPITQLAGMVPQGRMNAEEITMSQSIRAVFQGGVFRPFEVPLLAENQMVTLTVEEVEVDSTPPLSEEDPLAGIRFDGPVDLAENFDDYRFGRRSL